jgi:small redox-active disulfide protein 1
MVKVQVLYTQRCPHCPAAKELFRDLQKEYKFDYEEIDAMSKEGQELAIKHRIMGVPSVVIDGKLVFVGMPSREAAIEAIKK